MMPNLRPTRTVKWTRERIAALSTPEIKQLRANAERLNDPDVLAHCDALMTERLIASRAEAKARRAAQPARPKNAHAAGGAE
jgi:hypothetical protein